MTEAERRLLLDALEAGPDEDRRRMVAVVYALVAAAAAGIAGGIAIWRWLSPIVSLALGGL